MFLGWRDDSVVRKHTDLPKDLSSIPSFCSIVWLILLLRLWARVFYKSGLCGGMPVGKSALPQVILPLFSICVSVHLMNFFFFFSFLRNLPALIESFK